MPDDVLNVLSRFQSGLGNEYLWERLDSEIIKTYTLGAKNEQYMCAYKWNGNQGDMIEVSYSSELDIKPGNTASLKEPISKISVSWNDFSAASVLSGKFFYASIDTGSVQTNILVKGSTDGAPAKRPNPSPYIGVYFPAQPVENIKYEEAGKIDYVNSSSPDAYPPAEPDGYTYTVLGQLGNKVRIETGSYVGTGTSGEDNPNTLTFGFEPKFVVVGRTDSSDTSIGFIYGRGEATTANSAVIRLTWGGNFVSWYTTNSSAQNQLNVSGTTYNYFAIG